jgi:hypothetical protein
MAPQTHAQVHPPLPLQVGIELSHRLHDAQPDAHRTLRVVLVRLGVAEVDQQAIAEVLRDLPLEAGNHLGARRLIGPHHLAPLLGVELAGKAGGVHQVTEQHGELAAFGLWRMRFGCWGFDGGRSISLGRRHLHRRARWRGRRWGAAHVTDPDQHVTVLIHGNALGFDELLLQIVEDVVV